MERSVAEAICPHCPWLSWGPLFPLNYDMCWAYSWIDWFSRSATSGLVLLVQFLYLWNLPAWYIGELVHPNHSSLCGEGSFSYWSNTRRLFFTVKDVSNSCLLVYSIISTITQKCARCYRNSSYGGRRYRGVSKQTGWWSGSNLTPLRQQPPSYTSEVWSLSIIATGSLSTATL